MHALPGSNIVLSAQFVAELRVLPPNLHKIGAHQFAGQAQPTELCLIPSDRLRPGQLERLIQQAAEAA